MSLIGCPCPKCGKKTLRHPPHPHAFGYKQTDKVACRKCGREFDADKYFAWWEKKKQSNTANAGKGTNGQP